MTRTTLHLSVITLLPLLAVACGQSLPPNIDRVEIWAPNLHVTINARGKGYFVKAPYKRIGQFDIEPNQFAALVQRIEPFRRSSHTINAHEMKNFALFGPPCDGPYVTDNGGITLRWAGPSIDQFFAVDYGCDRNRYADRNRELRSILASLPVPEPNPLP